MTMLRRELYFAVIVAWAAAVWVYRIVNDSVVRKVYIVKLIGEKELKKRRTENQRK
jgi:hypothetical protein